MTSQALNRRRWAHLALATAALLQLAACAGLQTPPPALSPQRIAEIVASADRTAADRINDQRRKPEPLLAFIAPRPGMVALDLFAGGGYTSELLARAIGPGGQVHGQFQPRDAARLPTPPAAPEGNSHPMPGSASPASAVPVLPAVPAASPPPPAAPPRTSATALAERQQRMQSAGVAAAPLVAVASRFDDPVPAALASAQIDLVTLMFNYHDLGHMGVDRAAMNRALFKALKPGGVYVIADHAGRPGTGIAEAGTLHRIDEAFLRQEVEAAGFKWQASADFLRNPADPRDRNTPQPAMPKDEFVLRFVKP